MTTADWCDGAPNTAGESVRTQWVVERSRSSHEAYAAAGSAVVDRRFQLIHAYLEPSPRCDRPSRRSTCHGVAAAVDHLAQRERVARPDRRAGRQRQSRAVLAGFGRRRRVRLGRAILRTFDPRHLMWQAITRRVAAEVQPLSIDEAVTIEECLAAYTTGAAYASLCEDRRGMLRAGYLADWALWSGDPTSVTVDELRSLTVRRTDVGGRTVFIASD